MAGKYAVVTAKLFIPVEDPEGLHLGDGLPLRSAHHASRMSVVFVGAQECCGAPSPYHEVDCGACRRPENDPSPEVQAAGGNTHGREVSEGLGA